MHTLFSRHRLLGRGLLEEGLEPVRALEQAQALQVLLVLGEDAEVVLADDLGTLGHDGAAVEDAKDAVAAVDPDGLADQREGTE